MRLKSAVAPTRCTSNPLVSAAADALRAVILHVVLRAKAVRRMSLRARLHGELPFLILLDSAHGMAQRSSALARQRSSLSKKSEIFSLFEGGPLFKRTLPSKACHGGRS
jgi:hypothetical protein